MNNVGPMYRLLWIEYLSITEQGQTTESPYVYSDSIITQDRREALVVKAIRPQKSLRQQLL